MNSNFLPEEDRPGPLDPPGAGEAPQQVRVRLPLTRPIWTYIFIGLSLLVFALQAISDLVLGIDYPGAIGMKVNELIIAGQYWRLITPVLLHGSLIHIGFNMYALYILGPNVERFFGHGRFLMLYLVAGFAGNVLSFLFSNAPSVGASTAIFGLIAAQGMFIFQNRKMFGENATAMLSNIGMIILINLVIGFSPRIDNWGHLGGLLGGLIFTALAGPIYRVENTVAGATLKDRRSMLQVALVGIAEVILWGALALQKIF